jgi:D-aminoacyl-tRNA deacylase
MAQSGSVRIVIQRVSRASVSVSGRVVGSIGPGLMVLVGVAPADGEDEVDSAVEKLAGLRVFPDEAGLMNLSLGETGGSALVVSQFTLLADVRKGRRPSFTGAAPPLTAQPIVARLVDGLRAAGIHTETGQFGAAMSVELVNEGPVTVVMEITDGRVS